MQRTKTLARCGLLTAIALTIFLVEARLPELIPIPGVKLGLSNIVTVYAAFCLGPRQAVGILAARILLGSALSGQMMSLVYSACGGALSIAVTLLLRRILKPNQIWVAGCLGGLFHNLGQMAAALLITGTVQLLGYLPVLTASGMLAGLFTGLAAQMLINRWKKG